MPDEKPLTKSGLVAALHELRQQVRDDAFEDRTEFYTRMTKPAIEELGQELRAEMKVGFGQVNDRLEKLEADVTYVKREAQDIKADISTLPSRDEFDHLRKRVQRLEQYSAPAGS